MKEKTSNKNIQTSYLNKNFIESNEARPLRILSEYLEPLNRLRAQNVHDTVVFLGSARIKEDGLLGNYYKDARKLAHDLTLWSSTLSTAKRFVICSGGGGGIMEAANRGAVDAGGSSIGFNISLPHEQHPNSYITEELLFEFHYFFMRKFWFAHLARALIVFPGGFGTLDELLETLTLAQTKKFNRNILILLYGTGYWNEVINFDALVKYGTISENDLNLFKMVDSVEAAFNYLKENLPLDINESSPAIAKS